MTTRSQTKTKNELQSRSCWQYQNPLGGKRYVGSRCTAKALKESGPNKPGPSPCMEEIGADNPRVNTGQALGKPSTSKALPQLMLTQSLT